MIWFWLFVLYSFAGYGLEKLFAAATASPQQVRKCFLLLPLCPVYGLGMLAVLALPEGLTDTVWKLGIYGALTVTAVEFAVHWLYEKLLGVRFWDYSPVKGDVAGRVCLPFSVVWGMLVVLTVRLIHPWATALASLMPQWLSYAMLLVLTADAFFSALVLRRGGDVSLMGLGNLRQNLREE
jgi:uncharacterized membrane protein